MYSQEETRNVSSRVKSFLYIKLITLKSLVASFRSRMGNLSCFGIKRKPNGYLYVYSNCMFIIRLCLSILPRTVDENQAIE